MDGCQILLGALFSLKYNCCVYKIVTAKFKLDRYSKLTQLH